MQPLTDPPTALPDAAIIAFWQEHAGGQTPLEAWYHADGFNAEHATEAFLRAARDAFWDASKARVQINVDVKFERERGEGGRMLVRVSMPKRFVPSFSFDGRAFVVVSAMVPGRMHEFPAQGNASAPRVRAPMTSEATMFRPGDAFDAPPPKEMLRAARAATFQPPPPVPFPAPPQRVSPPAERSVRPVGPPPAPPRAPEAVPEPAPPREEPTTDRAARPAEAPLPRPLVRPPRPAPERVSDAKAAAPIPPIPPLPPTPPPAPRVKSILDDDPPPPAPIPIGLVLVFVAGIVLFAAAMVFAFR